MFISYERFDKIKKEKNITNYKIATDLNLAHSVFSDWKRGKSQPKYEKLKLIAEYIGTTPEYLITGNENENIKELKTLTEQKIIEDYRSLDDEGKKQLENFFDYLKNKSKNNSKYKKEKKQWST